MTQTRVSFFVVVFNKPLGKQVKITAYKSEPEALQALFDAEDEYLTGTTPNKYEVVLLGAADLDDLHKTHSRYFADGEGARDRDHLIAL
jgi:hypothetical protein